MFRSRLAIIFINLIWSWPCFAVTKISGEVGLSEGVQFSASSDLNPGNRIFEVPDLDMLADLRSELKITQKYLKYVLRPRLTQTYQSVKLTAPEDVKFKSQSKIDLTDAYVEWTPQDLWQYTAGLFVDGWGPAEFVNPSNPFFHLNFQNKKFFYKEKGHGLLRVLWNPTAQMTVALTGEPVSNNEPAFRSGEDFKPQAALRLEWQSKNASQLAGLLIGKEDSSEGFLAEYFQLRNDSFGTSLYAEARHSLNPSRFEVKDRTLYQELSLEKQNTIKTYSVLGLRWEGRFDSRLEWIYYEPGYSESDWKSLLQSVTQVSPAVITNSEKFARSGLEFPTKNWWSLSVRAPDLGPWSDWQWTNRFLIAVGDRGLGTLRSGIFQSDLEIPAFQAWTFFIEIQNNFGNNNTELLLASRQGYYVGTKFAW